MYFTSVKTNTAKSRFDGLMRRVVLVKPEKTKKSAKRKK
jgi:hypothetical protein